VNALSTVEILVRECEPSRYLLGNLRMARGLLTAYAQERLEGWALPRRQVASETPYQVIEFFCGCGGMSLGFASLDPFFSISGGCDIDPDAAATFEHNFTAPAILADVRRLAKDKAKLSVFLNGLKDCDDRPLVVIGCAPCQGFSAYRKKCWEKKDARNNLVGDFASVAVDLEPECIVMENVPEMLADKYWKYFEDARSTMEDAGYIVRQSIYNAASFGVPQERFRTLVVAMRHDFLLPEPLITDAGQYMTVRQAIGHLPMVLPGQEHPNLKLHRSARHRLETLETIRAVPKNGGSRPQGVGPRCLDRVSGFYDVYGRLCWDKPAITITHYARNPASGRFVHPEQDRGLTMREAALLQSFPLGFEFTGSFDAIFKQIGEAVPPKFACAVAASILTEMLSPPPTEEEKRHGVQSIDEPVSNSYSSVIAGYKMARRENGIHMR